MAGSNGSLAVIPPWDALLGLRRAFQLLLAMPNQDPPADALMDRDATWDLVARAQSGDNDAFALIYRLHYPMILGYTFCRVEDRWVDDIASETFLRAYEGIKGVRRREDRDLGAWLVTIARNLIIDHTRSSKFYFALDADELVRVSSPTERQPEAAAVTLLTQETLIQAVRKLSSSQQECITCRFLLDMPVTKTASVMNKAEGAVKLLQLRGVQSLRRLLPGWVSPAWEEVDR